ncbi:MAG: iron-containing alcohol dehydrogenase [Proteobacteria bacterium]|nr:iron-containing alcohol dehydrogenase [Pseudomonadota bacterium]
MASSFNIPSSVIIGGGASAELLPQLRRLGAKRVLVVTDAFMVKSGVVARLIAPLQEGGIETAVFDGVQPDPTVQNVRDGLALYRSSGAEAVVAIGGGSPLDAGKAISILTNNPEPLADYMGYHKIPKAGAPLLAIPTTAGTGSEVTKVAVITDTERDVKMMILDQHLLPVVALVDYELTLSMPAPLTAHVGVDTLTHGIEAYVSRKASEMTDPIALSCIRLAATHLVKAWEETGNLAAREGMMLSATQGGMAFANSSVCLVHGMSRPLGLLFHIPHGLSNAMLLPAVTRFSLPGAETRYATVARTMGLCAADASDASAAASLVEGLEKLNARLEVPRIRDFKDATLEVFEAALEKMASDALASGSPANNPVVPTASEIVQLYREAW